MDQRVILADGTTYENAGCGEAGGNLYCNIRGDNEFTSVLQKFMNPYNTQTITMQGGEVVTEYTGYTSIMSAAKMSTDTITITLRKPGGE